MWTIKIKTYFFAFHNITDNSSIHDFHGNRYDVEVYFSGLELNKKLLILGNIKVLKEIVDSVLSKEFNLQNLNKKFTLVTPEKIAESIFRKIENKMYNLNKETKEQLSEIVKVKKVRLWINSDCYVEYEW